MIFSFLSALTLVIAELYIYIALYYRYEPGKGLGKDHQGRVQPVPIIVLPPGKSLDQCMMMREKKLIKHKVRTCNATMHVDIRSGT